MKVKDYTEKIDIPEGVTLLVEGSLLTVSYNKNTIARQFTEPHITLNVEGSTLLLHTAVATRKEKMRMATFVAHIKNMVAGVIQPYVYKLRICSGHFPMNISVSGRQCIVKNFVGEKIPRILMLRDGVDVKIEGSDIIVSSPDKELAGMTAGALELLCRRPGFDPRIFQQGIYIIEKAGKPVV